MAKITEQQWRAQNKVFIRCMYAYIAWCKLFLFPLFHVCCCCVYVQVGNKAETIIVQNIHKICAFWLHGWFSAPVACQPHHWCMYLCLYCLELYCIFSLSLSVCMQASKAKKTKYHVLCSFLPFSPPPFLCFLFFWAIFLLFFNIFRQKFLGANAWVCRDKPRTLMIVCVHLCLIQFVDYNLENKLINMTYVALLYKTKLNDMHAYTQATKWEQNF